MHSDITPRQNAVSGLVDTIADAARAAFGALFRSEEHFYYCTLVVIGPGLRPVASAWSWEALEREAAKDADPVEARQMLKWSYADSPYFDAGAEYFAQVDNWLARHPFIYDATDTREWQVELDLMLAAMEAALLRLDAEGMFDHRQARDSIVIAAEIMPPDTSNIGRVKRLNPAAALPSWLEEAAEHDA